MGFFSLTPTPLLLRGAKFRLDEYKKELSIALQAHHLLKLHCLPPAHFNFFSSFQVK